MRAVSIAMLLALSSASGVGAVEVPLTVTEPVQVARRAAAVTSGVPLPKGTDPAGPWALLDGTTDIPIQVTPLPGGTPWILLDFQLDVKAGDTRRLVLRQRERSAPPPPGVPARPKAPETSLQVVDATSGQTWLGVAERETWEYGGPIRSVLRVDGRYGDVPGFGYTTRYTFYAGKRTVRIEHVLRNSLQHHERHLKLRSATLRIGDGVEPARVHRVGEALVVSRGSTVELLPTEQSGVRGGRGKPVTVDANGGYLLADLTHFAATVVFDPAREWTEAPPLMALAPPRWYAEHGELTTRRFGTLEDERESYRQWGWSWHPRQEPTVPEKPSGTVSMDRVDVHQDTEADDLWQNLLMYLRTGQYGYFVRAHEWAGYYTREYTYRTDGFPYAWGGAGEDDRVERPAVALPLTEADQRYLRATRNGRVDVRAWGAEHFYGWGLLDWAALTGQRDALEAAIDLGEISHRTHGKRTPDQKWRGNTRGLARHLLLTVRLWDATQDPAWKAHADHLAGLALGSQGWQEGWGTYAFDRPLRVPTPFQIGLLHHALARYDEVIGHPEVRRRLVRMAEFARRHALDPRWGHSAMSLYLDVPSPGEVTYANGKDIGAAWTAGTAPIVNPAHTMAWVDMLVRGYRLTGDPGFLTTAKDFWARASRTRFRSPATSRIAGPSEVGRFVNARLMRPHYFALNGDLPYVHLLFADAAAAAKPSAVGGSDRRSGSGSDRGHLAPPIRPVSYVASADAQAGPPAGPEAFPPSRSPARDMGDNTWREAKPAPRRAYASRVSPNTEPEDCLRTVTTANPISRTYTGLVGDGRSVVFFFGGGHASHPGNDVDLYRADDNRWEVQYPPECPLPGSPEAKAITSGGGGSLSVTPLGRPFTQHTYQQFTYDPRRKRWVGVTASARATWAYDSTTKRWTVLAGPSAGTFSPHWPLSGGLVLYDPIADRIIAIVRAPRRSNRGVYLFDPEANRWSFSGPFPSHVALTGQNLFGAYNPDRREFYLLNYRSSDNASPVKLYRYLPADQRWTSVDSLPVPLRKEPPMFDYDTCHRRVVFLLPPSAGSTAAVWTWDPVADAWEALPTPSPTPTGKNMMFRSFVYLADHNVFLFLQGLKHYCDSRRGGACGGDTRTWLYRYKDTGGRCAN